jgi:hypothetical protein
LISSRGKAPQPSRSIPHRTRDADGTGLSKSLQPSRDVDPIAEQIVALNDDVADEDADPKIASASLAMAS